MITTQPVNIRVNRSDPVVFSVIIIVGENGNEFTYQWKRNGSDLMETSGKFEGVQTAELTINNAQNEDEGSYRCVISNEAGDGVSSDEAILTVGKIQSLDCKIIWPAA